MIYIANCWEVFKSFILWMVLWNLWNIFLVNFKFSCKKLRAITVTHPQRLYMIDGETVRNWSSSATSMLCYL